MTFAAATVAVLGSIGGWAWALFKGGRQSANDRSEVLTKATEHTDREIEKIRLHQSAEHDKLWTEMRQLRQEANADRVSVAELRADVHHIRTTTDRILARLDKRSTD